MKSIRDFLAGKLRRAEVEDQLTLRFEDDADPELGALEAVLLGPRGRLAFFAEGLLVDGGVRIRYARLTRVAIDAEPPAVWIELDDGTRVRLESSPEGAVVTHATLRWIGLTQLRRWLTD